MAPGDQNLKLESNPKPDYKDSAANQKDDIDIHKVDKATESLQAHKKIIGKLKKCYKMMKIN